MRRGKPVEDARGAVIMLHGRGASAEDILSLAVFGDDLAYLAPQAEGRAWYPHPFTVPVEMNEPYLTQSLGVVDAMVEEVMRILPCERIALLGFSQGACLALEYALRNPRRYGGIIAFAGAHMSAGAEGDFRQTPVFLGCDAQDPYIPIERVRHSADVFSALHADVTLRIYTSVGHTVSEDALREAQAILSHL